MNAKSAKSTYIMEKAEEAVRLERQIELPGYNLAEELAGVKLAPGERVLDAGCGSGVVSRHLVSRFPKAQIEGCDLSDLRVQYAKQASKAWPTRVEFFRASLDTLPAPDATYDQIVSRYVFEHLPAPPAVARELHRVLKPGGKLTLIDFDGILFNLHHDNSWLAEMLGRLRTGLGFDLEIGRKLPAILRSAGFSNVVWDATLVVFQGETLAGELENMQQRFALAMEPLRKILGSEENAQRFCAEYLAEMARPGNTLTYNKFIVTGTK